MVPNNFHILSKNVVLQKLKEVFLEIVLCSCTQPGTQHNIRLHLIGLPKDNNPMYCFSFKPCFNAQFKFLIFYYKCLFVFKIWYQFFHFSYSHSLRQEWQFFVVFVQLVRFLCSSLHLLLKYTLFVYFNKFIYFFEKPHVLVIFGSLSALKVCLRPNNEDISLPRPDCIAL